MLQEAQDPTFKHAFEAGGIGAWELAIKNGRMDWSEQMFRLLGIALDSCDPTQAALLNAIHPDHRAHAASALAEFATRPGPLRMEVPTVPNGGQERWLVFLGQVRADPAGVPVRMLGVAIDSTARRRGEASVRDNEARLRLAMNVGGLATWEFDLATQVGTWSPEAATMHGLPPDRLTMSAEAWADLRHPEDRASASAAFRSAVAAGHDFSFEYRIIRPDNGALRWTAVQATVVAESGGWPSRVVGVVQDITERRNSEAELRESEERFRTFAEYAPHAIYIVDAVARRLEYLSPAFERIWGEPRATVMNDLSRWADFLHPQDRLRMRTLQLGFYLRAEPIEAEYRVVRPADGKIRHIRDTAVPIMDAAGRVVRVVGIAYDVTDHRQAEAAVRASDERMAMATAAAKLGVWDVDIQAGTGIHNREFRAMYGLPQDEGPVSHSEWLKLIHPEDRERMHQVALAAQAGEADYAVEFRINRADTGELRWIASQGSVVMSQPDCRPVRMVGVCYDVTERRKDQERELLLAREVDHRAKNVLAVVQSIVKLTRADDPRKFAQAVEGRVAALARAHTLLSRDRWTGASLTELVREEVLAYGGAGRIALEGPELWVNANAVQSLSMVLHELATNAAKYGALSVPHGRLSVSWRVLKDLAGEHLRLDWVERGGPRVLAPPERRGFGSTVVTAAMRGHLDGGAQMIWQKEGLHCEISMPTARVLATDASENPASAKNLHAADAEAGSAGQLLDGRRIMVVEDEPLLALEIGATLQQIGCELVGPASTLAEALRLADSEASSLDAAVMDVNLRGETSFPVAEVLASYGVPVIYVSGYGTLPPASIAAMDQAPFLLRKPLRDGDLAAALRLLLVRRAERDSDLRSA